MLLIIQWCHNIVDSYKYTIDYRCRKSKQVIREDAPIYENEAIALVPTNQVTYANVTNGTCSGHQGAQEGEYAEVTAYDTAVEAATIYENATQGTVAYTPGGSTVTGDYSNNSDTELRENEIYQKWINLLLACNNFK